MGSQREKGLFTIATCYRAGKVYKGRRVDGKVKSAMRTVKWARGPVGLLLALVCLGPAAGLAQPSLPGGGGPRQLEFWTFRDTNWLSGSGRPSLAFTNLASVEGMPAGTDLLLDTTNAFPAFLFYNVVETNGATNINCHDGSISLWLNPRWSSASLAGGAGPGDWGDVLSLGQWGTNDSSWWALYFNPDGTTLSLAAQTNGGSPTVYLSAPVNLVSNTWYNIVWTYSPTNSFLYTNGVLLTNGGGVTAWPGPDVTFFAVGSDTNGLFQARGMFSDLTTYVGQLDSNTISGWFNIESIFYYYGTNLPSESFAISSAPSSPGSIPTFDAITGPGFLRLDSTNSGGCVTSSNVWMTNVTAVLTNNGASITFTIAGGSNNLAYDVFATPALAYPITNATWSWMGQGYHCCTYTLTIQSNMTAFLLLGMPQDTDQDGLTDAYERLVSHTDPNNPDTSGSGMLDGWDVVFGLNPLADPTTQTGERSNFTYDPVGRLELLFGVEGETLGFDPEGNITGDSQ
jgi:hypothetical protein